MKHTRIIGLSAIRWKLLGRRKRIIHPHPEIEDTLWTQLKDTVRTLSQHRWYVDEI